MRKLLAALAVVAACAAAGAWAAGGIDLTKLQLGDLKKSSSPRRGYLFTCQPTTGQIHVTGPWLHGSTWDFTTKPTVDGDVSWPQASHAIRVVGAVRRIVTNDLPTGHGTGKFPIDTTDDAYTYDPGNRSGVAAQSLSIDIPASPKIARVTTCVGGEVGVALDGVVMNNAFDADGADAPAHEMQDRCGGHPHQPDLYHYHALPACIPTGPAGAHSRQIGWALDGFPIYGPLGEGGAYMTDDRLDACHGHTHTIVFNGKRVRMYHYHATMQFPYTVACFRGTPLVHGPIG